MVDGIIAPSAPIGAPPASTPAAAPASEPAPIANASDDTARDTGSNPIKTTPDEGPKEIKAKKPSSIEDSLNRATDKINKEEAAKVEKPVDSKAPDAKAEPKAKPAEAVKPADIKAEPWREVPKRFNDAEKAEWDKAPDTVKQGIHRAFSEAEKGIEKYKADATEYGELREFKELADKYKVPLKEAMANYVRLDQDLQSNDQQKKLNALQEVFRAAKIDPLKYAEFITKQPADKMATQTNQTIAELRSQIQQLQHQVKGVTTNVESQQAEQIKASLIDWAQDKPHAGDLANEIAGYVDQGLHIDEAYAKALEDAQEKARRLGFTLPAPQVPATNVTDLAAHTLKTGKSITGAPSPGSHPATQKPSKSIAEAVDRAHAMLG